MSVASVAQYVPHELFAHETQVGIVEPLMHAPLGPQLVPQRPQFAGSRVSEVSQPLAAFPSQSPKPALHVNPQAPAAHVTVAFARAGHGLLQRPQCAVLVLVLTSQPLADNESQFAKPATHTEPHVPAAHTAVLFAAVAHMLPQAPQ